MKCGPLMCPWEGKLCTHIARNSRLSPRSEAGFALMCLLGAGPRFPVRGGIQGFYAEQFSIDKKMIEVYMFCNPRLGQTVSLSFFSNT